MTKKYRIQYYDKGAISVLCKNQTNDIACEIPVQLTNIKTNPTIEIITKKIKQCLSQIKYTPMKIKKRKSHSISINKNNRFINSRRSYHYSKFQDDY